jgi:acetylornithine deacetylase/succinyl-diaminopimelate desuccinylase-like protein
MTDWFDELAEFLRIPSISAQVERGEDVKRAGQWVTDFIRGAGGEADLIDWHGQPLVVGEIKASRDPQQAPTLLCYGHFDVQPADPLELWQSPPFEPEIRGEYLYGRGVADDKGQLYMLLSAARELARAGQLPVNVRFACDGEEETGGHSIVEFVEQDQRGADVGIIFDSGMIGRGLPAFNIGTRGLVYFHLTLQSGDRDLHSGVYGGAALYLRTFAEPALDVNGMESGSPHVQKTVLPVRADANVSIRLAPGQQEDEIAEAFTRLMQEALPAGATLSIDRLSSARPGVVSPEEPALKLGADAFESVLGVRPLLTRTGGTLPIVAAFSDKGIPTILTGFSLPDADIHAPNEKLLAEYVTLGIEATKSLFTKLGEL